MERILGLITALVGVVIITLFQSTAPLIIGACTMLAGLGIMTRPKRSNGLVMIENFNTKKDLENGKLYKRGPFSPCQKKDKNLKFRVLLTFQEGPYIREKIFILPEKPPKEFVFQDGEYKETKSELKLAI